MLWLLHYRGNGGGYISIDISSFSYEVESEEGIYREHESGDAGTKQLRVEDRIRSRVMETRPGIRFFFGQLSKIKSH